MIEKLGYLSGAPRVSTRPEAEMGGPRAHVLGVINGFKANGIEVYPYVVGDKVPVDWLRGTDKELHSSTVKRIGADLVRLVMGEWHRNAAWNALAGKVDCVYERFAAFQAMGTRFAKQGVPWVLETNGLLSSESVHDRRSVALTRMLRRRERFAYRSADVIITVSDRLKKLVSSFAEIDDEKVIVVPNGVDIDRFSPPTGQRERVSDKPTIVFVGTLYRWQGIETLLTAMAQLHRNGMGYSLVVIGDGPDRERLESLAHIKGLATDVIFSGQKPWEHIPAMIGVADLCFAGHAPLSGGTMYHSPLKLYEYMAMAKPVVSTASADATSLIVDGETGFFFDATKTDSLVEALTRAWGMRQSWSRMGELARSEIDKNHSWARRVQGMLSEINERVTSGTMRSSGR